MLLWKAECIERCPLGLGKGSWKRADDQSTGTGTVRFNHSRQPFWKRGNAPASYFMVANQEKISSHSPSKGSLWVRCAQHAFPPLLLAVQGLESCCWIGSLPLFRKRSRVHCSTEKTWRGSERRDETKGAQPAAQRNTA